MARGTKEEFNGVKYASKFEARIAKQLTAIGISYEYEQRSLDYLLPITKSKCGDCGSTEVFGERTYTPDFYLPVYDIWLEIKGHFKPHDRKIIQLIKKQYDIDLRMVFLFNNRVTRQSENRYSDWCRQRGIPYALTWVPEEWLS